MEITDLAQALRAEGKDIIALSAGELSCNTIASAKAAGIAAINNNQTRYTHNMGELELRQAISDKFAKDYSVTYSPSQILVTAGVKQALFNIMLTLCDADDEVIVFAPYWVSYPEQITATGATMKVVRTSLENGFQIDTAEFSSALSARTKAVILNTPSNPTGAVYAEETVREIARLCAERGIWLISDEIYEKIVYAPHVHYSLLQAPEANLERVIVVNGFSKTYAMTGWRVGYAVGPEAVIKAAAKLQSHSTSNACSIAQAAALGALLGDQDGSNDSFFAKLLPELLIKRDSASRIINSAEPLKTMKPAGAYYLMVDVSGLFGRKAGDRQLQSASDVCKWFIEDLGVATTPGEAFGAPEYVRLSFSTDLALIEEACQRLADGVTSL